MFDDSELQDLAKEPQRIIAAIVRLKARLRLVNRPLARTEAAEVAGVTDTVYAEIEPRLSRYFRVSHGRLTWKDDSQAPKPWEITNDKDAAKLARQLEQRRAFLERLSADDDAARTKRELIEVCRVPKAQVESRYHWLVASHSHERIARALEHIKTMQPAPADPFTMLLSRLKRGIDIKVPPLSKPRTILRYQKPANAEKAKVEIVGWEAPTAFGAGGEPLWPAGLRRMVLRKRDGSITYEAPPPSVAVPSLVEDPGVIAR